MSRRFPEPGDIWETRLGWYNEVTSEWEYKKRPVLVLIVKSRKLIRICSMTSVKVGKNPPPGSISISKNSQNGLSLDSHILTYQLDTVSTSELLRYFGDVDESLLGKVLDSANNF